MGVLIFYGFLLLILLPLGEVTRVTIGGATSFTLLDIFVVGSAGIWIFLQLFKKWRLQSFQAKSFVFVLGIFFLSLMVNAHALTMQQLLPAGLYIVRFAAYGLLFFMVRGLPRETRKKILPFLMLSGLLLVVFGYAQYLWYPALRNLYYAGWDQDYYRMFATFFDPNFFGLFLSLFFLFLVAEFFRFSVKDNPKKFLLFFSLSAAVFLAILLTYSRTALLSLAIGLIFLFWKKNLWRWFAALFLVGALLAGAVFFISNQKTDVNRFFRVPSTMARITTAQNAVTIFLDDPVFGVGFNAYRYAQYRHHFKNAAAPVEDHGATGADTSLLLVLATSGIIGFSFFCFFLYAHVRALLKTKEKVGLAIFMAFIVGSLFVNALFYPLILTWVWIFLGVTESDAR